MTPRHTLWYNYVQQFPKLRNLGEFVFDRVIIMAKGKRKKAEEEEDME